MALVERAKPLSGGVKELRFPTIVAQTIANATGHIADGTFIVDVSEFKFKKLTFDSFLANQTVTQTISGIIKGSTDGVTYTNLWSASAYIRTPQEVDISGYNYIQFYSRTYGSTYSGGASYKNVVLSK